MCLFINIHQFIILILILMNVIKWCDDDHDHDVAWLHKHNTVCTLD